MFCTFSSGSTARPKRSESSRTREAAAFSSRKTPLCLGSVARTMFSATVITGISMKCWCTIPIPCSIAARGESIVICLPLTRISPASGW